MAEKTNHPTPRRAESRRADAGGLVFGPSLALCSGSDELDRALVDAYRLSATDVLAELWEADVERLCGERWKPRPRSRVTRAGWCGCQITLGGERVSLRRPRVRSVKGREIELPTFKAASSHDLLDRAAVEDITAVVTTGAFPPGRHLRKPIAADFVEGLANRMSAVQAIPRARFEPGLLIASIDFPDQTFLGAVGIDPSGKKQLAGLRAGSATNAPSVAAFLEDLVARHRRSAPPDIFFVGEDPVIQTAIREHFGAAAVLQRSPHEKRRRVLGLLPPSLQPGILESLLDAYAQPDARTAERAFRAVATTLEQDHPKAAALLSEGLSETLTLHRLAASGARAAARKGSRSTQPSA
jgi:hypothetical protein